jgi:hypothetical protein
VVNKVINNIKIFYKIFFKNLYNFFFLLLFVSRIKGCSGLVKKKRYGNLKNLFEAHFQFNKNHPCRAELFAALSLAKQNPLTIIETGSSAWGVDSSNLFDDYCNSFGGKLISVDNRVEPMLSLRRKLTKHSRFFCEDSLKFLSNISRLRLKQKVKKFIYLDSWDVDWKNPIPAAIHGLAEFLFVLPYLRPGDILLVDDSPKNSTILEKVQSKKIRKIYDKTFLKSKIRGGKGTLILNYLKSITGLKLINHKYQICLLCVNTIKVASNHKTETTSA